jgi:hypothetical protein
MVDTARLREIQDKLKSLVDEALQIVHQSGNRLEYDRAKGYWHPHIIMALSKDSDYLGASMFTLEETIYALEEDKEKK